MPANLTPEFYLAREAYEKASTPEEKLMTLQKMLSVIPKHKGTDKMQADIKRRISALKKEMDKKKGGARQEDPFAIDRQGAGQVVIMGFPNSGKSKLVEILTNARVKVASYPFSTPLPLPGMMPYRDILIQLIDTPPITEEGLEGPYIGMILRCDLILVLFNVGSHDCVDELRMTLEFLEEIHHEKKILVAATKMDLPESKEHLQIQQELFPIEYEMIEISTEEDTGLSLLKEKIFTYLDVIRVYSKAPGKDPDMETPFTLQRGSTVMEFASYVHKDFLENMKSARVWGSSRFDGQEVAQDYLLADGDIVELKS